MEERHDIRLRYKDGDVLHLQLWQVCTRGACRLLCFKKSGCIFHGGQEVEGAAFLSALLFITHHCMECGILRQGAQVMLRAGRENDGKRKKHH